MSKKEKPICLIKKNNIFYSIEFVFFISFHLLLFSAVSQVSVRWKPQSCFMMTATSVGCQQDQMPIILAVSRCIKTLQQTPLEWWVANCRLTSRYVTRKHISSNISVLQSFFCSFEKQWSKKIFTFVIRYNNPSLI